MKLKMLKISEGWLSKILKKFPVGWNEFTSRANLHLVFDGDRRIGMCGFSVNDDVLIVQVLDIYQQFQGRGYGMGILKALEKKAKKNGCKSMYLIFRDMSIAGFYEKARERIPMLVTKFEREG